MEKLDLKKEFAALYKAEVKKPAFVTAPPLNYLMTDGKGDPNNSPEFQLAVEALYSLSYTLKFMVKKSVLQIDYGVMPLEGLWWMDDMAQFVKENMADWKWTLMILQPDFITAELIREAKELVRKKKNLLTLDKVRFETMNEGICAQLLHMGPYGEEGPDIALLHNYIKENGYKLHGKHREIYLNDMRRTAPEKLKTIIRQPVIR